MYYIYDKQEKKKKKRNKNHFFLALKLQYFFSKTKST